MFLLHMAQMQEEHKLVQFAQRKQKKINKVAAYFTAFSPVSIHDDSQEDF